MNGTDEDDASRAFALVEAAVKTDLAAQDAHDHDWCGDECPDQGEDESDGEIWVCSLVGHGYHYAAHPCPSIREHPWDE